MINDVRSNRPDPTTSLLAPRAERAIQDQIKKIDSILAAGLVDRPLAAALEKERKALEKRLLTGAGNGTGQLLSDRMTKRLTARIRTINKLLTTAILTPAAEKKLVAEKAKLTKLLTAS